MIITIKGSAVDIFKDSNIGTLSTWTISRVLGDGATYAGDTFVDKNAALNATVTIADGYELGSAGVTVTMGGEAVTSGVTVDGNTITITISAVTGNVVIKVPTVDESGNESTGGTTTGTGLDEIAWGTMTYRELFITNNRAPAINNNSMTNAFGNITYTDSTGSTAIVSDSTAADNYVPPYSLKVTGTSSQQAKSANNSWAKTTTYFLAANIKVTDYTKGYCGMIFGSQFGACASAVTDGYEVFSYIGDSSNQTSSSTCQLFIGSASSANLTGYINNPVAIDMSIFTTAPSLEELTILYNNYTAKLIAGDK